VKKSPKRTRVNLRIQADLLKWAKKHAARMNTTLTQVIVNHLTQLKSMEASNANS
jgi:antitoxin component of RelBE/YafQ-DinJ toxin-antitoxin module